MYKYYLLILYFSDLLQDSEVLLLQHTQHDQLPSSVILQGLEAPFPSELQPESLYLAASNKLQGSEVHQQQLQGFQGLSNFAKVSNMTEQPVLSTELEKYFTLNIINVIKTRSNLRLPKKLHSFNRFKTWICSSTASCSLFLLNRLSIFFLLTGSKTPQIVTYKLKI